MATLFLTWMFCFVVVTFLCNLPYSVVEAISCGQLRVRQPTRLGKEVMLIFQPNDTSANSSIDWMYRKSPTVSSFISTTSHTLYFDKAADAFTMTIKQTERSDERHYFVRLYDGNGGEICDSEIVPLKLHQDTSLNSCGYLSHPLAIPQQTVKLSFQPKHVGFEEMFWYQDDQMIGTEEERFESTKDGNTFILIIRDLERSDEGRYRISNDNCSSGSVDVALIELGTCGLLIRNSESSVESGQLVRFVYVPANITARYSWIYRPTNSLQYERVPINGRRVKEIRRPNTKVISLQLRVRLSDAGNYIVQCQNTGQDRTDEWRLDVTAIVPGKPELTMNKLREDKSVNIICSTRGGRPAPQLHFKLTEGRRYNADDGRQAPEPRSVTPKQTNTLNVNKTYTSVAVIKNIERSWNNKQLKCCLNHDTGEQCTESKVIHYKFPPLDVKFNHTQLPEDYLPLYTIDFVCLIVDANPACEGSIEMNGRNIVENINRTYQQNEYGGTTTVLSYSRIFTQADNGTLLTCSANCSEFVSNRKDSLLLLLPGAADDEYLHKRRGIQTDLLIIGGPVMSVIVIIVIILIFRKCLARRQEGPASNREVVFFNNMVDRPSVILDTNYLEKLRGSGMDDTACAAIGEDDTAYVAIGDDTACVAIGEDVAEHVYTNTIQRRALRGEVDQLDEEEGYVKVAEGACSRQMRADGTQSRDETVNTPMEDIYSEIWDQTDEEYMEIRDLNVRYMPTKHQVSQYDEDEGGDEDDDDEAGYVKGGCHFNFYENEE